MIMFAQAKTEGWVDFFGDLHPIILHFPIALILMTAVAELMGLMSRSPIYRQAARFMIIFAAITAIPTALFGIAFGYQMTYKYPQTLFFWWHRFSGLTTAVWAIVTVVLEELSVRNKIKKRYYIWSLVLLVIFVTVTGYLGGEMTFYSSES